MNGKLWVEYGEVAGIDERQLVSAIRSALTELAKMVSQYVRRSLTGFHAVIPYGEKVLHF